MAHTIFYITLVESTLNAPSITKSKSTKALKESIYKLALVPRAVCKGVFSVTMSLATLGVTLVGVT